MAGHDYEIRSPHLWLQVHSGRRHGCFRRHRAALLFEGFDTPFQLRNLVLKRNLHLGLLSGGVLHEIRTPASRLRCAAHTSGALAVVTETPKRGRMHRSRPTARRGAWLRVFREAALVIVPMPMVRVPATCAVHGSSPAAGTGAAGNRDVAQASPNTMSRCTPGHDSPGQPYSPSCTL